MKEIDLIHGGNGGEFMKSVGDRLNDLGDRKYEIHYSVANSGGGIIHSALIISERPTRPTPANHLPH